MLHISRLIPDDKKLESEQMIFDSRFLIFNPLLIPNATCQTLCFNYTDLLKIECPLFDRICFI